MGGGPWSCGRIGAFVGFSLEGGMVSWDNLSAPYRTTSNLTTGYHPRKRWAQEKEVSGKSGEGELGLGLKA